MSSIVFNEMLDQKLIEMEERFRGLLEQYLATLFDRPVAVKGRRPEAFDFKELKASLPGEIVVVALNATYGGPGKMLFALTKDGAAQLSDLLLMGDGKAAFAHEEHIEPLRDLFREVIASYASDLGKELGKHIAFDEVRGTVVDLNPADFVGTGWTVTQLELGLEPPVVLVRLVSKDFVEACFPDAGARAEETDTSAEEELDLAELRSEMGLVLDIELPITIELGRTSMLIRDIVKLAPGSIVELDKLSGEPVDLFVNNKKFARGEVVVVDENFAVRITELVTVDERMRASRN